MSALDVTIRKRGRPRSFEDHDVFIATTKLLLDGGLRNLTLQRIADQLGLTNQAIGQRFSSRDGLLLAYLDWMRAVLQRDIEHLRHTLPSPLAALREFLVRPYSAVFPEIAVTASSERQSAWLQIGLELRTEAVLAEQIHDDYVESREMLMGWIREAQALGELLPAPPELIHECVSVAAAGALILWTISPNEDIFQKLTRCREQALAPFLP